MAVNEADLERMLRDLAVRIDWPPEPQLAPRVRSRLEVGPAVRQSLWERARPLIARPAVALAIAIIVVFGAVLIGSESARVAIADFLGLDGVRVEFVERLPADVGTKLDLGERITLDEARARVDFDVLVPTEDGLDTPDRVFFDAIVGRGQVTMVYAPRDELPPATRANVGLLIMQYDVSLDEPYYKKLVAGDSRIEEAIVGSDFGFWVTGPHTIEFRAGGIPGRDSIRLAENTLMWEHDGVTIRLESALSKGDALRIAESMQ